MKIKYHGHSCFSITSNGYTIVLDPYTGVKGLEDVKLTANEVIASHGHRDHAFTEGVKVIPATSTFKVDKIKTFHDGTKGSERGENFITILEAEGKKLVHLGDLGHLLEEAAVNEIKGCEVLMIPIGGFFTIDASQALQIIEEVKPKYVIPMHYRDGDKGYDVLGTVDEFLEMYKKPCLLVKGYEREVEI